LEQKGVGMIRIKEKCVDYTWMEAWSLADKILLEALHFLGMYMSTYSPASFCMLVQVGFGFSLVEVNQAIKAWSF